MSLKIIFAVIFLLAGVQAFSQSLPEESLNARVNQLINSKVKPDDPGLAVAVLKDGKTISKTAAGKANLDYSIPVSSQTSFNIASNAKQFTAVCLLLLEKDKLISLDDDFRKYTPAILKDYPGKTTRPILLLK